MQGRRNGGAWRVHCPLTFERGGQRGHSCPYMTGYLVILGSPKLPPALLNGGNRSWSAFSYQNHKQFYGLSRSTWNKFIAAICIPITFVIVFYNFCYYFWGQHCCCVKMRIIGNDFNAAIRAPIKFRMFFYNFYYYFWGQHCCYAKTSIIGNVFKKYVSIAFNSSTALLLFWRPFHHAWAQLGGWH